MPQLPWGHIVRLMQMIKDESQREWYAAQTIKNGWSRSVLEMQIESELYERQAESNKKVSNFHKQLPALQSDLANEMLKDHSSAYIFFRRLFSASSSFNRDIMDASIPPYLARHL